MSYSIRLLTKEDEPFLWQMLYEAAQLHKEGYLTAQDAMTHPELKKYVHHWGQKNDLGFVAISSNEQPIGAAWLRLFMEENKGYGYIDDQTPELAIAIVPKYRNQGIGTQLLTHLIASAKIVYPAISLTVRSSNPALYLYKKLGWKIVEGSDMINRVGSISLKMKLDFI
ncbi:GNAT family N-acetyltransferase [Anabaena sp. WFMT]|uniref:GNAT family N-acetyltransferase n=1 Tax=Anabaena sp. WFMT TaxID=3449730 RepID=UPI003F20BB84